MKICPNCHRESQDEMKFCSGCGHALPESAVSAPAAAEAVTAEEAKAVIVSGEAGAVNTSRESGAVYAAAPEITENKAAGTLGAFLFAIAGGLVYFILARVGYLASISGLAGIYCAIKGYKTFGKKLSTYGVVAAAAATVIMIILAWYFSMVWDFYKYFLDQYISVSFGDCCKLAFALFFTDKGIMLAYGKDLLIGLALAALGCWRTVRSEFAAHKEDSWEMQQARISAARAAHMAGASAPTPASSPAVSEDPAEEERTE